MSIKGFNINGSVEKYDYRSLDNLPGDAGLSEQAKRALLACFEQVAWIGADGKTYYDALEEALYPQGYASVTNTLVGCHSTNEATLVAIGKPYNATIIVDSGYTLTGATVSITMGGTSVTGYYSNGTIAIPNVTGDIVIAVTAASAISSITAVFTQGSAVIYDTDSLDTLKQYLVVTATFSDSTTATVTDYTLSGTLTAGTSTITASYGGKTDTFSVTVTRLEIKVFRGKGTSGTAIADKANRALSEPVAFENEAPITIQWDSYSTIKMGFKNTTTNTNVIDTTAIIIVPIERLGTVYSGADGWVTTTAECAIAYRSNQSDPCNAYVYPTTSGYARLLFANSTNMSQPLPSTPIDGVIYINGIPYHLVETPVSEFE